MPSARSDAGVEARVCDDQGKVLPQGEVGTIEVRGPNMLKGGLANYKVPKRVYFADSLPRNTMGKVQKNQLRDRFMDADR